MIRARKDQAGVDHYHNNKEDAHGERPGPDKTSESKGG
jgi:hypothetical protein